MELKKCSECGRMLPISEFNKNRNSRDGLQDRCRDCFSAYNKRRYQEKRDRTRKDVHDYQRDNKMNVYLSRQKTWDSREKHTKVEARRLSGAAVAAGIIDRPDHCQACGCSSEEHRIEAHHDDYERPLDVIWLCTPCHRRADAARVAREAGMNPFDPYAGFCTKPSLTPEQDEALFISWAMGLETRSAMAERLGIDGNSVTMAIRRAAMHHIALSMND